MPARATSPRRWPQLAEHYAGRGLELVERGGRWHFQTAPDLAHLLRRTREEPRRLSRAATETLAIIAYHEPVSRAEIEAIRGVQISKGTIDVLMDAGWVRAAGRREGPGRPLLYATTAGVPVALRAGLAPRPAGDRRFEGRRPARPARRGRLATATGKRGRGGLRGGSSLVRSIYMGGFSLWHILIFAIILLLLFGGNRFSAMMGDVAKGLKSFKQGMADEDKPHDAPRRPRQIPPQQQPPIDVTPAAASPPSRPRRRPTTARAKPPGRCSASTPPNSLSSRSWPCCSSGPRNCRAR